MRKTLSVTVTDVLLSQLNDCTHFITKDNIIFTVRGFSHLLNAIRAIPLYVADSAGTRKSKFTDKTFTRAVDEFGDNWLYKVKPAYLEKTKLGRAILVPREDIIQTFDPFNLPQETKDEISKTKFAPVLLALKEIGIKDEDIGFIGSYLVGLQNGNSDIDILIRGIQNMQKVKENMNFLRKKIGAVGFLDEKRKTATLNRYNNVYNFERNDFEPMLSRRWSTIRIGDEIMLKLLFSYKKEEFSEGLLPDELRGETYIEGRVINDDGVCFMPRHFIIENEKGMFRVLTYFWHFYYCVKKGDKVGIFGSLSKDGTCIVLHNRKLHGVKYIK